MSPESNRTVWGSSHQQSDNLLVQLDLDLSSHLHPAKNQTGQVVAILSTYRAVTAVIETRVGPFVLISIPRNIGRTDSVQ